MTRYDSHSSPELLAAQSLYDEINGRALEVEAAKQLPADLASKINDAGLYRMAIPKVYGGPERTLAHCCVPTKPLLMRTGRSAGAA